ncbi:MAG TPA: type I-C CRISPR-associated protein Cas8c/Csd1 [Smithellaceae bacterium]|jgi:CRISPR-associated protein Csd1|nr:type I-C CRISPR-associated protein Cas8c/Csd1 [Smithellaceae bacterium]
MIKELSDFGKPVCEQKYGEWNHVALKEEPISIDLVIDEMGNFCKFVSVEKTTIAEALTSKKGKARLLLDKAEEVLGCGKNAKKKQQLFLDKIREYADLVELEPVISFYEKNKINGILKAEQEFTKQFPEEKQRRGNIAFRISGRGHRICEEPNVRNKIINAYEHQYRKGKTCSVCGEAKYPVGDIPHGMIKHVPNGQTSGCALVSYNDSAFESYALRGNENSSICTNCAKEYVEGMKHLLEDGTKIVNAKGKEDVIYAHRWPRKRSQNYGIDTAIVFWTRRNKELPEIDQLETPNPADVNKLLESVSSGKEETGRYIEVDQLYSCTLSGAAARIAVRDWIELSLYDYRKSIAQWFKDIAIIKYDKDLKNIKTYYAGLYDLSRSCQRRNSDGRYDKDDTALARVASNLWIAALKNTALPLWILTKVLQRARLDKDGVSSERAALIKIILNRNNKGGGFVITENIMEGSRPIAYVCGEIFAKLESIQYFASSGERNAGIRERYFTYAMTLPAAAFGRIFDLSSKHIRKLKNEKPGLAINLDKELQSLICDINVLPTTFTLEEKGQFAIGYYHQRQKQFNKPIIKENGEEA